MNAQHGDTEAQNDPYLCETYSTDYQDYNYNNPNDYEDQEVHNNWGKDQEYIKNYNHDTEEQECHNIDVISNPRNYTNSQIYRNKYRKTFNHRKDYPKPNYYDRQETHYKRNQNYNQQPMNYGHHLDAHQRKKRYKHDNYYM